MTTSTFDPNCRTSRELDRIRAKLKTPAQLWASIQEEFAARDAANRPPKPGKVPRKPVLWGVASGWCCLAMTKSEARGIYKRTCGREVPPGTKFFRVE